MKIACIWSRETPSFIWSKMKEIWRLLAKNWHIVASWNAKGSDYYFASGANEINPSNVFLYLPWKWMNKEHYIAWNKIIIESEQISEDVENMLKKVHYFWESTSNSVKLLHRRNYWIVKDSSCVICYTSNWKDKGWTWVWIRIAKEMKIPIFNLYNSTAFDDIKKFLSLQS